MATRKQLTLTALVLGVVLAAGCGIDETGVRSVAFTIEPVPMVDLPIGIDADVLAAVSLASGTVSADPYEDAGMVMVKGLAALPGDARYLVVLQFASSERAGLGGGGGGEEVGHEHGALTNGEYASAGSDMSSVVLGALTTPGDGSWTTNFASADLGEQPLGALRGAMIMLIPETGPAVMILEGEVEAPEAESGEGVGHAHGA